MCMKQLAKQDFILTYYIIYIYNLTNSMKVYGILILTANGSLVLLPTSCPWFGKQIIVL